MQGDLSANSGDDESPANTLAKSGRKIKVLLMLPSLHGGGAERVAVDLWRHCDRDRFDIQVMLLVKSGDYFESIDTEDLLYSPIGRRFLEVDGPNSSNYRPGRLLVSAILAPLNIWLTIRRSRPDVVVTFLKGMNIATYFAFWGLWGRRRPGWIAREGNNAWAVIDDEIANRFGRWFIKGLLRRTYRAADRCLTISTQLGADMAAWLGSRRSQTVAIHNCVDLSAIRAKASNGEGIPNDRGYVVTAGRLEYQKGQDILLRSFASSTVCADRKLVILGKGSCQEALRRLAHDLGIGDRVIFAGFVDNPWVFFAGADLFVLPSRWEGFGNVVAEAMGVGAPCVVTDCNYGPSEIVEHGRSGWVVPKDDAPALTAAIDHLLGNAQLRNELGKNGKKRAESFDITVGVSAYSALFAEVAGT